jgi:ankyrin repeat protein
MLANQIDQIDSPLTEEQIQQGVKAVEALPAIFLSGELLHIAAKKSDRLAGALLKKGLDPNRQINGEREGRTPLHEALAARNVACITLLANQPTIDFSKADDQLQTPAHYAAQMSMAECAPLLAKNADFSSSVTDKEGLTPAHMAARSGNLELLKKLQPADLDVQDNLGRTPFYLACMYGQLDVAQWLLGQANVNPNQPDKKGKEPVDAAFQHATTEKGSQLCELLIHSPKINRPKLPGSSSTATSSAAAATPLAAAGASAPSDPAKPCLLELALHGEVTGCIETLIGGSPLSTAQFQGLSLVEYAVVFGLHEVKDWLNTKGIYFTYDPSRKASLHEALTNKYGRQLNKQCATPQFAQFDMVDLGMKYDRHMHPQVGSNQVKERNENDFDHYLRGVEIDQKHKEAGTLLKDAEIFQVCSGLGQALQQFFPERYLNIFLFLKPEQLLNVALPPAQAAQGAQNSSQAFNEIEKVKAKLPEEYRTLAGMKKLIKLAATCGAQLVSKGYRIDQKVLLVGDEPKPEPVIRLGVREVKPEEVSPEAVEIMRVVKHIMDPPVPAGS